MPLTELYILPLEICQGSPAFPQSHKRKPVRDPIHLNTQASFPWLLLNTPEVHSEVERQLNLDHNLSGNKTLVLSCLWCSGLQGAPLRAWVMTSTVLKDAYSLEEKIWQTLTAYKKSRNIILLTKVCIVKAMVFPVVTYGCENWSIKKAEHWRVDAFELWCWRRLLTVPWTARRSNQSILKDISPEYSLEWLMLKLKFQYFGHPIRRSDSLEKTLMLGKIEGRRRRDDRGWDGWMISPTQWTQVWANYGRQWRTGKPGMLQCLGFQRIKHDWATE